MNFLSLGAKDFIMVALLPVYRSVAVSVAVSTFSHKLDQHIATPPD